MYLCCIFAIIPIQRVRQSIRSDRCTSANYADRKRYLVMTYTADGYKMSVRINLQDVNYIELIVFLTKRRMFVLIYANNA